MSATCRWPAAFIFYLASAGLVAPLEPGHRPNNQGRPRVAVRRPPRRHRCGATRYPTLRRTRRLSGLPVQHGRPRGGGGGRSGHVRRPPVPKLPQYNYMQNAAGERPGSNLPQHTYLIWPLPDSRKAVSPDTGPTTKVTHKQPTYRRNPSVPSHSIFYSRLQHPTAAGDQQKNIPRPYQRR